MINNPSACERPTPATACGPHEEEFKAAADGGFYLGSGAVTDDDGIVRLSVTAHVGDASNVLCGGAANPEYDACARGFVLRDPHTAEVTLVVLDNGPAATDWDALARHLAAPSPCPNCPPFTAQIAVGFGREVEMPMGHEAGRIGSRCVATVSRTPEFWCTPRVLSARSVDGRPRAALLFPIARRRDPVTGVAPGLQNRRAG